MDAAVSAKIAKLLPMLGSSHDGEVVAAARAIERTLKSAGLTFHDLAASKQAPPRQSQQPEHGFPQSAPMGRDQAWANAYYDYWSRQRTEAAARHRAKTEPMFSVPSDEVDEVADKLLACELNIKERVFVNTMKKKTAYGELVWFSAKQHMWWSNIREAYGW
jgi:hypothetical protein